MGWLICGSNSVGGGACGIDARRLRHSGVGVLV